MIRDWIAVAVVLGILAVPVVAELASSTSVSSLRTAFVKPPGDARILMRWWWFGSAVEKQELARELNIMKAAGIGGVEIQPVYPLGLDDPSKGISNLPYLSSAFLEAIRFTATTAREMGLRVDVTLGSGWPYGGPHTTVNEAAGKLRYELVHLPEGTRSVPLPSLSDGETLIAAFLGGHQVTRIANGRIELPTGISGNDALQFFIASRTGQQVKRAAVGAEGFVLDHYDKSAIENHLASVADHLLAAFGDQPPHSVFSDSLEVYGSDWTGNFLPEFQKRRGYDLTPYLPALIAGMGRQSAAIRHDWGKTLTELAEDNYLKPIQSWAHAHGTLFRSQTYGEPPVILSSNALVDLPEGEHGPSWRRFSAARWASSASHLYSKPITSAETWTWLHSPAFRATPLDMKAEADRHFVQGINQLIGHGWPYSPDSAGEPGWHFYAAAAFNNHNPWFGVMPDITLYLQRISFLLRQGKPSNDIAIYVPTDDAWARLQPGKATVDEAVDALLGPALIPQILNAGYNFDFIDDRAISAVGLPYKLLILPNVERIPLATLKRLQQFTEEGGLLVATQSTPSSGTGLLEEKTETSAIKDLSHQLFETGTKNRRLVADVDNLGSALTGMLPPDFATTGNSSSIGFVHRHLPGAEIYFVVNSSNRHITTTAALRVSGLSPEYWDPFTGEATAPSFTLDAGRTKLHLELEPYESRTIIFSKNRQSPPVRETSPGQIIDLSTDWKLTFSGLGYSTTYQRLHSWTEEERTRFYSGQVNYEKTIDIPPSFLNHGAKAILDFGPGSQVEPNPGEALGMRARLESPVHEAALIYVNAQRAGTIWRPPYQADLTKFLKAGKNELKLEVANLAINEMAGRTPADYRLLNLRYGERFVPQDMNDLKPVISGITGTIRLVQTLLLTATESPESQTPSATTSQ